ncbi:MAG: hypothetical protein MUO43_11025 [Desulfobacterales bacterium]|nr:hypothetical protein [Desulfobacterales bacterium]
MGPIRSVIKEELANSYRLKRSYERKLKKLPRGALVRKNISGHDYYYLAVRDGAKVKYIYKGKLPPKEVEKYDQVKRDRKKYKALLSETKKQITFLERSLKIGS